MKQEQRKKKIQKHTTLKVVCFSCLGLLSVFIAYCFFPIIFHSPEARPERIYLLDSNDTVITNMANTYGYRKKSKIPLNSNFVQALLTIEDKSYYSHLGINIPAKFRAIVDNISGNSISGGSTITEQWIKNTYFPKANRSYLQKAREAILAMYFSSTLSKETILEKYLDSIYFGNNIYGLPAASEVYFGKKDIHKLSQEEINILLTLLHRPAVTNLQSRKFIRYSNKIQSRLGYTFTPTIRTLPKTPSLNMFPFVTKKFIEETGKLTGKTSINSELQLFSKNILKNTVQNLQTKNISNGAIFGLNPKTMEVLVYVGSSDFHSKKIEGQVDVITSLRQPGSTVKPFLYLLALKKGAGTHSLLLDISREYQSFQDGYTYLSENYSLKEYGLIPLKNALGNSLNNATVRLAQELGLKTVFDFYKHNGFRLIHGSPQHYGFGLVLGNPSLSLENMVLSYVNLLPNYKTQAQRKFSFSYQEDEDKLYQNYKSRISKIDPEKYLLYNILTNPDNRDISFGVNSILNTSIPQAVKTGTSSNFRDNLVISYHPDFILGIWIGNNDNSPMKGITGISGAGYIWHHIIEEAIALGYITDKKYEVPPGVEKIKYCLSTTCNRVKQDYDKKGANYNSFLSENIFSQNDIFEQLSQQEIHKLHTLGISIQQQKN